MTFQPSEPLPDRSSLQTSAIILIVVGFLCGGTIPAVFGIISLVQLDSDPYTAKKMNKIGWIVFWVMLGLLILFAIAYVLFFVVMLGAFTLPFMTGG
ncbi:MAG: hypothetical protein L0H74_05225 [Brachybacterium sp.]|nr:hypothetical protein [Brachybacterium sp.]MDN5899451.1 hypothetical protein [Brachybacterium sp.]